MPWRECYQMDERLRFVARLLEGEKMAVLCREFDIDVRYRTDGHLSDVVCYRSDSLSD